MLFGKTNKGFVILAGMIFVGAIGLAAAVVLTTVGLSALNDSQTLTQSRQALVLAEACAEEALQQINDSTAYTGSGTQTIDSQLCEYSVLNLGGQNREIQATATIGEFTSNLEVLIDQITPEISVISWEEVSVF